MRIFFKFKVSDFLGWFYSFGQTLSGLALLFLRDPEAVSRGFTVLGRRSVA